MKGLLFRLLTIALLICCVIIGIEHGVGAGLFCAFCASTALASQMRPLHVLGANSFDPAFVTDIALTEAITTLQNKLAALALFSTKFTTDPVAPLRKIDVPLVTGTDAVQVNPTTFETGGDSTAGKIQVSVNHLFKLFYITFEELQQGYQLETLFKINLQALANAIMDAATAPLTVANYGAPIVTTPATDFGTDDLKLLFAAAKDFDIKALLLDGSYLAQFIPTNKWQFTLGEEGAYGFDRMAMNNRWNGGAPNLVGVVGCPAGLAVASGMPVIHRSIADKMLISEQITIPSLGLVIMFNVWGSLASRTVFGSYEVMFGAAKGDTPQMKLITSA